MRIQFQIKKESKDRTSIQFDHVGESSVYKGEIFSQFKKVFSVITESQIHNYYSKDLASMKKDNKFKEKCCLTQTLRGAIKPISVV